MRGFQRPFHNATSFSSLFAHEEDFSGLPPYQSGALFIRSELADSFGGMTDKRSSSAPGSFPFSELNVSEEEGILTRARIARFSQTVLSAEAWFRVANELIVAMELLEPHIESFWKCLRDQVFHRSKDPEPEYSLVNVHMMLAGFAIENLCKGYLAGRLSSEERDAVRAGSLPKYLLGAHNVLEFVERTGMTLSQTERYLVKRIGEAIWRGRYPIPTSHEKTGPSAQIGSDIRQIKTLLQRLRAHVGAKASYVIVPAGQDAPRDKN